MTQMTQSGLSLSGLLDRAMRRDDPTTLRVAGMGSISVYPRQQCYVSDVADWDGVFSRPGIQFTEAPAMQQPSPEDAQPLIELHWRTAYHQILTEGTPESVTWDLFQLVSWPNLSRLPEELVEPVTRICALLWRKPTVGFLVSRVLAMPAQQTLAVLTLLRTHGHAITPSATQRASVGMGASTPPGAAPSGFEDTHPVFTAEAAPVEVKQPAKQSLVGKLWRRLLGN